MLYMDCFKNRCDKPIIAEGSVYQGKTEINMSSIYTKLIQEAGRFCDYYASDILIDIDSVRNAIELNQSDTFYFGFRESGVDHKAYIECRTPYECAEYRAIYKLDLKFVEDDYYDYKIEATLNQVYYSTSAHEWKKMKEVR